MAVTTDARVPQGSSYDQAVVIEAATDLYEVLCSMAGNSPDDLQYAPPKGWQHLTHELIVSQHGKTEEVYSLLKHMPYVRQDPKNVTSSGNKYLITKWTELCDYNNSVYLPCLEANILSLGVELPPWTVVLTRQIEGRYGSYYVLDTTDGTVTKMGYDSFYNEERQHDYETTDPRAWRNHAQCASTIQEVTEPAVDFFERFAKRFRQLDSILVQSTGFSGVLEKWDGEAREALKRIYHKHGWYSSFDQAACESELPLWYTQVKNGVFE